MVSNQLSISASINVILQVPLQAPVMQRELANKMYSPSAYFLGRYFSNILVQILYPMIMILWLFWFLDIDTSGNNFLWFCLFGNLSNFVFCGQGYFLGITFPDESNVKIINFLFIMVFIASNGVLCNLATANWFIVGLSKVSPTRFNCEGFLRRFILQVPDYSHNIPPLPISQEDILQKFDYTYGDDHCLIGLVCWFFFWIIASLISINWKYRTL